MIVSNTLINFKTHVGMYMETVKYLMQVYILQRSRQGSQLSIMLIRFNIQWSNV